MPETLIGYVVSHTHWDRAWYLPFQAFRLRLVRLVDDLLDLLEKTPAFLSFTLDGQTVILEDYLALRPGNRDRIAALVKAGRLLIGPWYTLPDLLLAGGESVVRNLQIGNAVSRAFGEPMKVGYVPDSFGHFAQLPQILSGFGISSFLFMRGADESIEKAGSIFDWRAPDGSTVLAVYLRDGYLSCSALGHPSVWGRFDGHEPDLGTARKRVDDAVALLAPLQRERSLLLPNGCDHMPPQEELPALLEGLNRQNPTLELRQSTLPEFLAAVRAENIVHGSIGGDLLGNLHHPILSSVSSTRIYLKQLNRRAENALVRLAEPLRACFGRFFDCPDAAPFLDEAWRLLLRNQAHDDICGCSIDEVHRENEVRFAEVLQIAHALVTEGLERLLEIGLQKPAETGANASDLFLFNPHPFPVKAKIRTSTLFPNPGGEWAESTPERALRAVSGSGKPLEIAVESTTARTVRAAFLETTWGRRYTFALDVTMPPFSYDIIHVFETGSPPAPRTARAAPVLENDQYRVSLEHGRPAVLKKSSGRSFPEILRFEYEFDRGDTYSFSPVAGAVPIPAVFQELRWHEEKTDTLLLTWHLEVPSGLPRGKEPAPLTTIAIETEVSLSAEESLEFTVRYVNTARNGRLRALLPIGFSTAHLVVDGHFRTATRSLPPHREPLKRPYPGETPYDTFPQGEFAFAESGDRRVWLANRGNPELSLVRRDAGSWFALTLHRAVGDLSVDGGAIRQCQAGPQLPVPEAQCLRPLEHQFAWGAGTLTESEITRKALAFACPVHVQEMPFLPHLTKEGSTPRNWSFLEIDNPRVQLSAFRTCGETGVVIRLFNRSDKTETVGLNFGFPTQVYRLADLQERPDPETERNIENGRAIFVLRPYHIMTVVVQ